MTCELIYSVPLLFHTWKLNILQIFPSVETLAMLHLCLNADCSFLCGFLIGLPPNWPPDLLVKLWKHWPRMPSTTCNVAKHNHNSVVKTDRIHKTGICIVNRLNVVCPSVSKEKKKWRRNTARIYICIYFQLFSHLCFKHFPKRPLHLHAYPLMALGSHAVLGIPSLEALTHDSQACLFSLFWHCSVFFPFSFFFFSAPCALFETFSACRCINRAVFN